jgi:hypothetical protein
MTTSTPPAPGLSSIRETRRTRRVSPPSPGTPGGHMGTLYSQIFRSSETNTNQIFLPPLADFTMKKPSKRIGVLEQNIRIFFLPQQRAFSGENSPLGGRRLHRPRRLLAAVGCFDDMGRRMTARTPYRRHEASMSVVDVWPQRTPSQSVTRSWSFWQNYRLPLSVVHQFKQEAV